MMNFNIGEINKTTPHLFADLAELLVCLHFNGSSSLHKNALTGICKSASTSLEDIDDEIRLLSSVDGDANYREYKDTQLDDVWAHLEYRSRTLNKLYPFDVTNSELQLKPSNDSKYEVYYLLLACSRLRSFSSNNGIRQRWASAFAELCKYSMCGLMPTHADVKVFDANSTDRRSYFGTNLRGALKKLGSDLGALCVNEEECGRASQSGDVGIDLVAIVNFDDGAATTYAVLGQCGAQQVEWPKKTLEAHPDKHRSFFQTLFSWPSVMFTPVTYRRVDGSWVSNQSASGILLLDRGRILWLLEKENSWHSIFAEHWFLNFKDEFSKLRYE